MEERLQKYMASCGVASRRRSESMIQEGKVKVNGEVVTQLGTKIDPEQDIVEVNGKRVLPLEIKTTVVLNKPAGYVTTAHDQFNRPSVVDLVDIPGVRLFPIGRLDYQTTGLLLLTNDGDLSYTLTHPKKQVKKVYQALVKGAITLENVRQLEEGIVLDDGYKTAPAKVNVLSVRGGVSKVEITIHEGKNRQVRRMMDQLNLPVLKLKRVQEGPLRLGTLAEGKYRVLSEKEVELLKGNIKGKSSEDKTR